MHLMLKIMRRLLYKPASIRLFTPSLLLASFFLLSCNTPDKIIHWIQSPTPMSINIETPTSSPIFTHTPSLTSTPTVTKSLTPTISFTSTRTNTPQLPTITPGPNEMTNNTDVWKLTSVDFPAYISVFGQRFAPPLRKNPSQAFVFIRLNFECTTRTSLIQLYTGKDLGLTFVFKEIGYPDILIEDGQGQKHHVTLLGSCWLAAPIASNRTQDGVFVLHFKDQSPFQLK